jgi:hypothetical protein
MPLPGRIRQFKIITGSFFGVLILSLLIAIIYHYKASMEGEEIDERVNRRNFAFASANPFVFTDRPRTAAKPKGVYRIAVLGDSFIWGDGLPYEKVWSHKLEQQLTAAYDSVEVISWGHNGWSTRDEFIFFKEHGIDFDIDLLIIGWVENDPDLGQIKQIIPRDPAQEYPLTFRISPTLAKLFVHNNPRNSYQESMEAMYGDQNMKEYGKLLKQFHSYLSDRDIPVLIVMTPGPDFKNDKRKLFDAAKPLIIQAGFNCYDLYDPVQEKLHRYHAWELQANPINSHPGDLMTEEFANDVRAYLEQNKYLSKLHKKGR